MRILVWFRNDLRLRDNRVLHEAVMAADELVLFYCFDEIFEQQLPGNFAKTGTFRRQFLEESLSALQEELAKMDCDLVVRQGKTADEIRLIHHQYPLDAIYHESQPTFEELSVQHNVASLGITIKSFWHSTLVDPEDLAFHISQMPRVFTDFRKKVEKQGHIRKPLPMPARLKTTKGLAKSLKGLAGGAMDQNFTDQDSINYTGGEQEAWRRLEEYFWLQDRLKDYKQTRNGMLGPNYSSKLSVALAHGCLSPVQIYHEVKRYEQERVSNSSTYWLVFELWWRDFFRLTALKVSDSFFKVNRHKPTVWTEAHQRWRNGKTGQLLIDACMNELRQTGYLSNRGRQLVASYLINDMKQDWYPGAQWFESVLIDYDVTSNYGNWTYLAGVGNDPRNNRYFNLEKQAQMYDPEGQYQKKWAGE